VGAIELHDESETKTVCSSVKKVISGTRFRQQAPEIQFYSLSPSGHNKYPECLF